MTITHVLVSYSSVLIAEFERLLPPGSVLIVEDQDVLDARRVRERVADASCVAQVLAAPVQNPAIWSILAERIDRPLALRAVIPATEYGVGAAASLADAWGVPSLGTHGAAIMRDKSVLRATMAGVVRQPAWQVCEAYADAESFLAAHPDGCVVKPVGRQGSIGVHVVTSVSCLQSAWQDINGLSERARARSSPEDRVLIESLLCGDEVSAESVVRDGHVLFTNITAKQLFPGARPVERGHVVPAPIPTVVRERLAGAVGLLVTTCGVDTAVLHSEWILVDGEPHLVECGARLPGDGITTLVDLAYGTSFVAAFLALLAGDDVDLPREPTCAAGIRFLSARAGVVHEVSGLDPARALPGVKEVACGLTPGSSVHTTVDSNTRHAHVLATGANAAEVSATLDLAERTIRIATRRS